MNNRSLSQLHISFERFRSFHKHIVCSMNNCMWVGGDRIFVEDFSRASPTASMETGIHTYSHEDAGWLHGSDAL